jgi:Mg-chelatase subunit ChlI
MINERLDLRVGLRSPAAFLHGSILTEEEAEGEIRTPLLDRLDHGKAAAGRRSVQQRRSELHRVLRHIWHESPHVVHGEDGADHIS